MILVILAVFIVLALVGGWWDDFDWDNPLVGLGCLGIAGSLITILVLLISVSNLNIIDEKIAMYVEENTVIESRLAEVVNQYQEYEKEIFTEVSPENSVTFVSLYPELKADALVQKQMEMYVENNETIKELKEIKIQGSVYRWWLYFGG